MTFAVAQIIAAFIAGSEAMMGDSAAMIVDALTYLFNWYAERQKKTYAEKLKGEQDQTGKSLLQYRKYTYQLELIPPLLSVSALLVVTAFVMNQAMRVLILDTKRDVSEQANPNTRLMMLFSFLNLLLDFLNVFCFAKAKHAMGYKTSTDEDEEGGDIKYVTTMKSLLSDDEFGSLDDDDLGSSSSDDEDENSSKGKNKMEPLEIEDTISDQDDHHRDEESNLNMCSAYTVRSSFNLDLSLDI
jgi:Co/Zn/Cd efflux system component